MLMKLTFKLFIYVAFVFMASACTDEYRLERKEDRLYGAWIFESAAFRENGDLFRSNRDAEFVGDIIEFYRDYTASFDDRLDRVVYPGNWELILDRATYDGEDDAEFLLDMDFFDRGRPAMTYLCGVNNLSWERLNLRANVRGGVYYFRLRRL